MKHIYYSLIPKFLEKMDTPSNQLEISIMTHEEEEEMQHDISKLRDQVQQLSLAQKGTESKMDCLTRV